MGDSSENRGSFGDKGVIEFTGKIMVVAFIFFTCIMSFILCVHLSAKWFWHRGQENTASTRRQRRLDFAAGHQEITVVSASGHGLDPLILRTIPVVVFNPIEFKDLLECSVCLSELVAGERARLLPKCNHGFHIGCIDMWFQSHSTCPLCRNTVGSQNQSHLAAESASEMRLEAALEENPRVYSADAPNFPTNVLFWGNQIQISRAFGPNSEENQEASPGGEQFSSALSMASTSNSSYTKSVVKIPSQISEEEEQKASSPTRMRALKRLLSGGGGKRVNALDMEQGGGGQI